MAEDRYRWLIELYDTKQAISLHDAALMDKADWFESLCAEKALTHSGNLTSILCSQCDVPHTLKVHPLTYKAYCAEAGYVQYKPEDTMQFAASQDWIFQSLRASLLIANADKIHECVPDVLWNLGQTRLQKKLFPVYLTRSQNCGASFSHETFFQKNGSTPGVVFQTSGNATKTYAGFKEVPLSLVMTTHTNKLEIDADQLTRIWIGQALSKERFTHSPDYSTVWLDGKPYTFSGAGCDIIKYLHAAHLKGNGRVKTSEMMQAIGLPKERAFSQHFSNKKDCNWKDLIAYGAEAGLPRGYSRLKIDS